jgi:hypothetical protein
MGARGGGAVDLIERPVIIRWFALMFSLGAWAGIAFVALKNLG